MRNSKAKTINLNEDRIVAIKAITEYYIAKIEYDMAYDRLADVRNRNYSEYWELIKPAQSKRDNARRKYERCALEYEKELVKDLKRFGTTPIEYARKYKLIDFPDYV